jgi:DNA repair ATPase RecN
MMEQEILDILKTIQNGMKTMQNELKETNDRLERVESKTDQNTLLLEEANKEIETIAEVQGSFSEQWDRTKNQDGKSLSERLNIIELAVSDTSSRVKDIQKDLLRVIRVTGENWAEIVALKAIR